MALEAVALVSLGWHPASGRPRRSPLDARAVELGLRLAGPALTLVHAGDADVPALRDYLGMGAAMLTVLTIPAEADPVPALVAYLEELRPDLVLAGLRGEGGEDSGLVPYFVAEGLGLPLAAQVVAVEVEDRRARVLQALPRGQRRALSAPLPLVVAVDGAAPAPRQAAFAKARRGLVETVQGLAVADKARRCWEERPARQRPRRLKVTKDKSAADRLKAATETQTGQGRVLANLEPEEAARAIYDYLVEEGIVRRGGRNEQH